MNRVMRSIICAAVLCSVLGCASTKQYVSLPDQSQHLDNPEQSRIYVMRPAFVGAAISMGVRDGDMHIGSTGSKGYLCWEREPGMTTISSKSENTSKVDLNAQAGSVYYLIQHVQMGLLIARNKLELVDEAKGQEALQKCKPPTVSTP